MVGYYNMFPVLFSIGNLSVSSFGVFLTLGFLLGIFLVWRLCRAWDLDEEKILDITLVTFIGGLIGARLYFVFILEPVYFWHHPAEIFAVWRGGMAIHGGIIGGILGVWFAAKKLRVRDVWFWLDAAAPVLALGQAIGRWGNYFNQEVYGKLTSLPWGIPIKGQIEYFHPAFLYESMLDLILALILWKLFRRSNKLGSQSGQVVAIYLVGYGVIRFLMEFVRIDPTLSFGVLRLPQLVGLAMIVVGVYTYHYVGKFSTTAARI